MAKNYKRYSSNRSTRKDLEKQGCEKIKIKSGKVVSMINKKGELVDGDSKPVVSE